MNRLINKKSTPIFIAFLLFALLFSCKKILNPDVVQLPVDANAYRTPSDIDKGLAAAYSFLRAVVPDKVFLMGDLRANEFSSYSQSSNTRPETLIATNALTTLLLNNGGDWNGFYRVIAQCNLILEKIPTISNYDAVTQKKHIGEASFIRALSYFYLARFWGDVPINLKSVDFSNIPRSPQADVFKQINADLDVAIADLQIVYNNNNGADKQVRATKGAAWAIKAHVMAWNHDYAACEKLCDSVITRGQYTLVADTNNLISIFAGKSTEGIFELNFDASIKEVQKNKVYYRTLGRPWYIDQSDGGGGTDKYIMFPTRPQLNQLFPIGATDARKFTWFIKANYNNPGQTDADARVFFGKYRTLQLQGDTSTQNINESNIIITRLPDIMLLRAEALASTGIGRNAEATTLLNAVRGRAKARAYAGDGNIQDTILLERKRELYGEGQYFFDLVRTRKLAQDSKITDANWYEEGAWLLPINQTILAQSNYVITQNSYWR